MFKTIDDFTAAIDGVAQPNRYEVDFGRPAFRTTFPKNEYKYLLTSINIPGQELRTNSAHFWGMKKEIVSALDYDPITATFICDKDLRIRRAFEEWLDEIVNKGTFTVGYYNDYTCYMDIYLLNRQLEKIRKYHIREVHPANISDISLGYGKNDEPMSFTVSLKYWDYEIENLNMEG